MLVLGGGIAGVAAAIAFRKKGFEVELVSERDYIFIYPIAIWIPVGTTHFNDVALPLKKIARRYRFKLTIDRVKALDPTTGSIMLEKEGIRRNLGLVVVALGADKVKHEGIENTLSICGAPDQSLQLKEKIDTLIQQGHGRITFGFGGNPKDPSGVRGGPAFELFFNLHHRLKKLGIRERFEMTFFAPMSAPGAKMGEKTLKKLDTMFKARNLRQHYGKKITRFEMDGIIFEDNSRLPGDIIMFIPASTGHSVITQSSLPLNESGFIQIDNYCRVDGLKGWYAIGDAAALKGPDWKAKQGHIAELMADCAANNAAIEHLHLPGNLMGYQEHLNILCVMDTGDGAGFIFRNDTKQMMIPMPVFGHWLKKGWGLYYKLTKTGRIPRIPGI